MTEITAAVVELARIAFYAYAVKQGRDVIVHWLDKTPGQSAERQVLDLANRWGVDLQALAEGQRTV